APFAIDPEEAAKARARAGMLTSYEAKAQALQRESEDAGLGTPPATVLSDLEWYTRYQQEIKTGMKPSERWKVIASLLDEKYGTNYSGITPAYQGQAEALIDQLLPTLYPAYREWDSLVQQVQDARLEAEPVG